MKCPVCGSRSHVIDTRPIAVGHRKRRICNGCSNRFSTKEIYFDQVQTMQVENMKAEVTKIVEAELQEAVRRIMEKMSRALERKQQSEVTPEVLQPRRTQPVRAEPIFAHELYDNDGIRLRKKA